MASPAAGAGRGRPGAGRDAVVQSLVDRQNLSVSRYESSCLVQRLRKLFNFVCLKLLLPEGTQLGSPIGALRGAPVWFINK